jgi:hypothetical protein
MTHRLYMDPPLLVGREKSTVEITIVATHACGLAFPAGGTGSIAGHDTARSVGRVVAVAAGQG